MWHASSSTTPAQPHRPPEGRVPSPAMSRTDIAPGPASDPHARSWVRGAGGSDFPLQNLPYGSCRRRGDEAETFLGVRIGDSVLDLRAASALGVFDDLDDPARSSVDATDLGPLLAAGRPAWIEVRQRVGELLADGAPDAARLVPCLVDVDDVDLLLPFPVADFVDFYSSLDHASNIGRMFRPDADPLLPNWRHLPVGYHGRAGTVVVTGAPVTRPHGQRLEPSGDVAFGPTQKLDIELEVGFVVGGRSDPGHPVPTSAVRDHVFGVVLVNDWSARDIQSWEYVPLGPFLGKSFATSISGWVVPLDALEPFRVPGPRQQPPVLPYPQCDEPWGLAIELSVELRPEGGDARTIAEVGFDRTYWTAAQQLAHLTVNGATVRPGDLFASGTVSGPTRRERGSLIELTWNGTEPLDLGDGVVRRFLEDGDEVTMRGRCATEGHPSIGLGEVSGAVRDRAR